MPPIIARRGSLWSRPAFRYPTHVKSHEERTSWIAMKCSELLQLSYRCCWPIQESLRGTLHLGHGNTSTLPSFSNCTCSNHTQSGTLTQYCARNEKQEDDAVQLHARN